MMKCPFCQFDNEDGALFCEQCKSDLGGEMAIAPPDVGVPLAEPFLPRADAAEDTIPLANLAGTEAPPLAAFVEEATLNENLPDKEEPAGDKKSPRTVPSLEGPEGISALQTPEAKPTPPAKPPASPPPSARLSAPATSPSMPSQFPVGAQPKLLVVRGQKINMEYPLYEGHNFVGRADEKPVDIDLEDQESPDRVWSSRQHALITFEDGMLLIEDLNSSNGTFVNRTRVYPGQRRPLQVNDVIQIGTVQMKVKG